MNIPGCKYLLVALILLHLTLLLYLTTKSRCLLHSSFLSSSVNHSESPREQSYSVKVETSTQQIISGKPTTSYKAADRKKYIPRFLDSAVKMHYAENAVRDLWLFSLYQFDRLRTKGNSFGLTQSMNLIEHEIGEFYRVILNELDKIKEDEGWNKWKRKECSRLSRSVQSRILALQNPKNCSSAPRLVCNLTNPHGFASGIHDVLWCFIRAYHSGMMVVLITSHWHYAPHSWTKYFQPLSRSCQDVEQGAMPSKMPLHEWPGENGNPHRSQMRKLPRDFVETVAHLHNDPHAWWYGQFMRYILRPQPDFLNFLQESKHLLGFSHPIVGMHVRRTDKIGSEAKSHPISAYMRHVDDFYKRLEIKQMKTVERKVFIATDDPKVIEECHLRFPNYIFVYDEKSAISASPNTRYQNESIQRVLLDIYLLAHTDYIVCTFSSGFCRVAYELKESFPVNQTTDLAHSLDVGFHYAFVNNPRRSVVYPHVAGAPKELSLWPGDVITKKSEFAVVYEALEGKTNSGFGQGKLLRNNAEGYFPFYKTRPFFETMTATSGGPHCCTSNEPTDDLNPALNELLLPIL